MRVDRLAGLGGDVDAALAVFGGDGGNSVGPVAVMVCRMSCGSRPCANSPATTARRISASLRVWKLPAWCCWNARPPAR